MVTFGIDISHHQDRSLDLTRARREGIEFILLKATEGASFVDEDFVANLVEARAAGLLVAAYHYVRSNATATAQLANVTRVVPRDVPVILDVEQNSGTLPRVRDLVYVLRQAGYRVPLLYLPRWYWQQLGSPDLRGLPPLWSSRYPDNVVGGLRDEFARVPSHYWNGYGGLDVAVLQFTSSARVAGHAPLDANAFRGTREQLAALLGYREETNVKDLVLARTSDTDATFWVGDGLRRRQLEDLTELDGLQFWIRELGGNPAVRIIADLRVLGEVDPEVVPVQVDYDRLVTDVVQRLTDALEARGLATAEGVRDVVREVFRDAGSEAE